MNKFCKKAACGALATCLLVGGASTAFAADVNSTGSVEADVNASTGVVVDSPAGQDTTQGKQTEYETKTIDYTAVDSTCDVYATQAAGEKVYDPEGTDPQNPPDENGFVNGSVQALLPKTVILDGVASSQADAGISDDAIEGQVNYGKYVVAVKGNISGTQYIKVAPSATFKMSQEGKNDIDAKIAQAKQHFYIADSTLEAAGTDALGQKGVTPYFSDCTTVGTVYTVKPITAGRWASNVGTSTSPTFSLQLVETRA